MAHSHGNQPSGGARGAIASVTARARAKARDQQFDPLADVGRAQDLTREGVIASGELLRPELLGRIGDTLGGLNSIGALRSGGTTVALSDLNREFTDRFGLIASRATLGAIDSGISAGGLRLEDRRLRFQQDESRRRRRSALLGSIGSIVGAGIGFAVGGPAGAVHRHDRRLLDDRPGDSHHRRLGQYRVGRQSKAGRHTADLADHETESANGGTEGGPTPQGEAAAEQGRDTPEREKSSPAPAREGADNGGQFTNITEKLARLKESLAKQNTLDGLEGFLVVPMLEKTVAELTTDEKAAWRERVDQHRDALDNMA